MPKPRPVVVLGPTAGGKSELAVALAETLGGEVIGADSMQIYRHLNAGTAKPEPALRARAAHHMIDIVEPTESFTVADWLERTDTLIESLLTDGKVPIVVGGTNLYIKSLLEGMFAGPPADAAFRESLAGLPGGQLHERLQSIDPAAAERIHPNDIRRLTRALEVFHATGTPISALQTQWEGKRGLGPGAWGLGDAKVGSSGDGPGRGYRYGAVLVGLDWPVEQINRRINARVKLMFEPANGVESLPDEVCRLRSQGVLGYQASQALGYKQVIDHLEGRTTLDEAFERTKILTRQFARSQRTWLKRFRGVHWMKAGEVPGAQLAAEAVNIVTDEFKAI